MTAVSDDDAGTILNANDREARRLLELAIAFDNATHPMTSTEVNTKYYPDLSAESFRKAFIRDRRKLALCGLVIKRTNKQPDEPLWVADAEASFAPANALTQKEALVLDLACAPLASDPSFPYGNDLRMALTKIDRSFSGASMARISPKAKQRSTLLTKIESCFTHQHAANITYDKADGARIERTVGVMGFFTLRRNTYFVGQTLSKGGVPVTGQVRTYRLSRLASVSELAKVSYVVPPDFDVDDYKRLPFQLGDTTCVGRMRTPVPVPADMRALIHQYGSNITSNDDCITWECEISDVALAASWCIAGRTMPLQPQELVCAWRTTLEGVLQDGR